MTSYKCSVTVLSTDTQIAARSAVFLETETSERGSYLLYEKGHLEFLSHGYTSQPAHTVMSYKYGMV